MLRTLKDNVYFVGIQDEKLKYFDVVLETKYGTTYNAYLVMGKDKIALIDTVKDKFTDEFLVHLEEVCPISDIDYIVVAHNEPDHSGALEAVIERAPKAQLIASRSGANLVKEVLNKDIDCMIVKTGDTLDLGGKTLEFIELPFLHWPDNLGTYIREDKILFPNDFTGCHYGKESMTCGLDDKELQETQKYYFDMIMSPFKQFVLDGLDKIEPLDKDIIAPSHGPLLEGHLIDDIQKSLREWSSDILEKNDPKAVYVGYLSCYGYTKALGEEIKKAIEEDGFTCLFEDMATKEIGDIVKAIEKADAVALGSCTINRDALAPAWDVMTRINPYITKGKKAVAFGSYGWSGEAPKYIEERLKNLGFTVVGTTRTRLKPNDEALKEAYDLGKALSESLK